MAEDPPREDFASRTRPRPRAFRPYEFLEATASEIARDAVALGQEFVRDQALEGATLRAFERASGAALRGDERFVGERLAEVNVFRHAAAEALVASSERAIALAITLLRDPLVLEVIGRTSRPSHEPLDVLLPEHELAILYRGGITINELRRIVVTTVRAEPAIELARALELAAPALTDFAKVLSEWAPEIEVPRG